MNTQDWQASNTHFLSLSLAWLRLKLERFAQPSPVSVTSTAIILPASIPPAPNVTSSWKELFTASSVNQLPAPSSSASAESVDKNLDPRLEQLAQLESELEASADVEPPPALVMLANQLGLTSFEQNILLLCAAM